MTTKPLARLKLGEEASQLALDSDGKHSAAALERNILRLKIEAENSAGLTLIAARLRSLQLMLAANAASTDAESQEAIGYMLDAGRVHEEAVLNLTSENKPSLNTLQQRLVEFNQMTQTVENSDAEKTVEDNEEIDKPGDEIELD